MCGTSDVCAVEQVAQCNNDVCGVTQLATTTCATNFVLSVSGTICTTSAKDIIYIISLALVVQTVPLTGKTKLVAQVFVASCATAQTSLVPHTQ